MNPQLAPILNDLEKRLALFHELATSLEQAQTAILTHDVARLSHLTVQQQELCGAITDRDGVALSDLPQPDERRQTLVHDLQQIETRVRHLNRVHRALLRRSWRSLNILSRLLASAAMTYTPPQSDAASCQSQGK